MTQDKPRARRPESLADPFHAQAPYPGPPEPTTPAQAPRSPREGK